jgi:hypothetical protein
MTEEELSPQKRGAIKRQRRKAAKKGVKTRKEYKAAKKRSEAAKKGVATRIAKRAS